MKQANEPHPVELVPKELKEKNQEGRTTDIIKDWCRGKQNLRLKQNEAYRQEVLAK